MHSRDVPMLGPHQNLSWPNGKINGLSHHEAGSIAKTSHLQLGGEVTDSLRIIVVMHLPHLVYCQQTFCSTQQCTIRT